ncbi:MAG: helix-turn-helix transcriptional regulator [Planctomycetales bacterium]|nr:helix-turn-helix transcriptional regulator [Planctomycetales bacterium]
MALIRVVNEEVAHLAGGPLSRWSEPRPSQLAPREREVLHCLLEGDSDAQIAARLHVSRYTVNQYTKRIYRHFGVHACAALLARWVSRGWGNGSDWATAESLPRLEAHA